jgi:D-threonate/D-erythronate kinase
LTANKIQPSVKQLLFVVMSVPTPRLAILADDLTGALDASVPFASAPGGVVVATRPEALADALASGAEIVAVSTRSREMDARMARARVTEVLAALPAGIRLVKKIDSRLKGNIEAELTAFGAVAMVILPAIPEFGRVVRDGALSGFGVDRPILVGEVLGRTVARAPDVETQAAMIGEVRAAPVETLLVGARGMTQALAEVMGIAPPPEMPPLPLPVCVAVGSTDPITLAQVAALRSACAEMDHVLAPSGVLPAAVAPLRQVTLLQATTGEETRRDRVAAAFAQTALPYLRGARAIVLTGGATAEAVLDALAVDVLHVAGEALPGMAYCRHGSQAIVTKSGGFGGPDTFIRLLGRPLSGGM